MEDDKFPRIQFDEPFDELRAYEVRSRGWYEFQVELLGGRKVKVFFYDIARLTQELESAVKQGFPFIAAKNMVVVEEVTLDKIHKSIDRLVLDGFFE